MRLSTVALILTLTSGLFFAPLATNARQVGKVARIGWLLPFRSGPRTGANVFRQAMRELGWVEGQNLGLEFRDAALQYERFPALAAELVQLKPDVFIGHTTLSALAARRATTAIPIVMICGDDAVSEGLVASLAYPGGNSLGWSIPYAEVSGKRLEFPVPARLVTGVAEVLAMFDT
jgi:ABC transporter substrate binding protein